MLLRRWSLLLGFHAKRTVATTVSKLLVDLDLPLDPDSGQKSRIECSPKKDRFSGFHQKRIVSSYRRIVVSSYRRIVVVPFTCGIGIGILLNFRSFPGRICARSRLTGKLPRQNLVSLSIRTSFDRHAPSFTSCQIFICVGTLHSNIIRFYCTKCRRRFPGWR